MPFLFSRNMDFWNTWIFALRKKVTLTHPEIIQKKLTQILEAKAISFLEKNTSKNNLHGHDLGKHSLDRISKEQ